MKKYMNKEERIFDIELSKIPLINLRNEFNITYQHLCSHKFYRQIIVYKEPIDISILIWLSRPESLLTLMLQRAIVGLELYVCGAVYIEGGGRGLLNHENIKCIHNPFLLKGRSSADNFYNRLPGMIDSRIEMKILNKKLWKNTLKFYSEIRNPIFHGYEFAKSDLLKTYKCFVLLAEIYEWIDIWHSLENLIPGGSVLSSINEKVKPEWLNRIKK